MTTKPSYTPALRFPDFLNDGEWEVKRLGEIAKTFSGGTPSANNKNYYGGNIPFIRSGEINSDRTELFLTQDGLDNSSAKIVEKGTILYALYGATSGEVGIAQMKGAINQAILAIIPKEDVDALFLYQFLKSQKKSIVNLYIQGGQGNLSGAIINSLVIPFPPLSEQRRIAQALTALDELIAATNGKLELMKAYKKGLMQKLFVDSTGGGKSLKINYLQIPKLRFPEFYEEKEWIYYNGDKMFEPIVNKNHNSDLPVLAITQDQGAIPRDLIDYNVIVSDKSIEAYKVVEIGDFIISLRSFQGGIEYSKFKGLCSPAYIVLRKKSDDVCDDFYRYYFKSNQYIQDLNRNLEGIRDGKMVSYKQFSDIMIPCPKYEEQRKIASCLSTMDETINAYTEKVGLLGQYKKGLMQQMFVN